MKNAIDDNSVLIHAMSYSSYARAFYAKQSWVEKSKYCRNKSEIPAIYLFYFQQLVFDFHSSLLIVTDNMGDGENNSGKHKSSENR